MALNYENIVRRREFRSSRDRIEPGSTPGTVHRLWSVCPWTDYVSDYDLENLLTYSRLLDAAVDGGSEYEMARIIFAIDPRKEPLRAEVVVESHLRRARWMIEHGCPFLNW